MSGNQRNGMAWLPVLAIAAAIAGCGPRLVDPGPGPARTPPPHLSPPAGGPVIPIQARPAIDTGSVPRVPASSVLTVPERGGPPAARYHTVERGDTLTAIARRYGTSLAALLEANGLDRDTILNPGQLIYIPE